MTREETIKVLQEAGSRFAKENGFTDMQIGEDRQNGIWGEKFTEYLEKTYGECTKEIRWYKPENEKSYVEFRFRFANPVIAVRTFDRGDKRESLASLEFSDMKADWTHFDEERELSKWAQTEDKKTGHFVDYIHDDDFELSEMQIWGEKGLDYQKELIEEIKIVKEELGIDRDDADKSDDFEYEM